MNRLTLILTFGLVLHFGLILGVMVVIITYNFSFESDYCLKTGFESGWRW